MTTNEIDPFSEDLEAEAVRRGQELERSSWRAPVRLVSAQWRRFQHVHHERTIIDSRWKSAAATLRRLDALKEDQAKVLTLAMIAVGLRLQDLGAENTSRVPLGSLSREAVELLPEAGRRALAMQVVMALRKGTPEQHDLGDQLASAVFPLGALNAEWKRKKQEFDAEHEALRMVRLRWGAAWDELETAALDHEKRTGLHTKLFLRSGNELNRLGIPAVVPVIGLRDQVRGLVQWAKAKLAAKPLVVGVMSAMAASTLTVATVAGAYAWHTHATHTVASGAGVNRH